MSQYHVQRSVKINASPEQVFSTIADYRTWTTWSPWLCAEPDAKVAVTADPASVGSIYSWQGELVGQGELEHISLRPNEVIDDEIRFIKPFSSKAQVSFECSPVEGGTEVTWFMQGFLPWFLFWMKSQIEIFIGFDYERGLRMLKDLIEDGHIDSTVKIRGVESVGPLHVVGLRRSCTMDQIGPSMHDALQQVCQEFQTHDLAAAGKVISVYHVFDFKSRHCEYTAGMPVAELPESLPNGLSSWSLPAVKAICTEHIGSYKHLGNAWSSAHQYARYKKLKLSKLGAYEVYENDPETTPLADLVTQVVLPLK